VHVQLLHDAAARVRLALSAAAASTSSPALAAAAGDVAQKLASSMCALPMHQHRMVEEFKALVGCHAAGSAHAACGGSASVQAWDACGG
jgi:hypothetical protein